MIGNGRFPPVADYGRRHYRFAMRIDRTMLLALWLGWVGLRGAYGDKIVAVDLLCTAIVCSTAFACVWVHDRLWSDGPSKKLGIGAVSLLSAIAIFLAAWRVSLLPILALDIASVPMATAAVMYSMIVGGAVLSLALIWSGCRQALQRWRYYRNLERSRVG